MTTELAERRQKLISTLRAGTLPKGTGSLCVREELFDEEFEEYVFRATGYCCVGVGLKLSTDLTDYVLSQDNEDDYQQFQDVYAVSDTVKDYLVSMNDGDPRPGYTTRPGPEFREIRSHPFIARFLEIVWALEEQAA